LSLDKAFTFEHQPDATLSKENPDQNQWYTVLDSKKNCRIYAVTVLVWTTNETLEVRITIDGQVLVGSVEATHTTYYYVHHKLYAAATSALAIDGNVFLLGHYAPIEGREVKVEVRKTTNSGSGTLDARVTYAKR
jgi:hypothetical protein